MEDKDFSNDPVYTAWSLSRKPEYPYTSFEGICGRCGRADSVYSVDQVVSRNFTDWETLSPATEGLCAACVFSLTHEGIKVHPYMVSSTEAHFIMKQNLIDLLAKPLPFDTAVSVPVSCKKHLLPKAEFGKVVSDDGAFYWGENECEMFKIVLEMRALDVTESELFETAPPYNAIKKNINQSGIIFEKWPLLNKWHNSPQFKVAVRASREPKELTL